MPATQKIKLKIQGMHCSSCALLIDSDLEDLEGVSCANTSYAKQGTEVDFDSARVSLEKILETIKATGYKAEVI